MSLLTQRALNAIEWSLIQSALATRTRSPLGRARAQAHAPFANAGQARELRARVIEACVLLAQSPVHGYVSDTADPGDLFDRASREAVLSAAELWVCAHFVATVGTLGKELRARAATTPLWAADFEHAPPTPTIYGTITKSVTPAGEILDSASSDLARLRRERASMRVSFESTLDTKIKDWNSQGLLQDTFYDVIDGRYVVPVKAEQQSKFDGALCGKSNTGQSVFVEPTELMRHNNALKELDLAIRGEEYRILRELSARIGKLSDAFLPWVEVVGALDLALAAAKLTQDWELTEPLVRSRLRLKEVFHPQLKEQGIEIVKNSFQVHEGGHGVLISGPNTGGKTVLLKATALAANMARAGLLVPAKEGSELPHYAEVLAFIGDEQNIAAGLSSFSAQIMDMKAVLSEKKTPMLLIIDEMLSSTDPEEASALAQTLIEEFVEHGHHVLVTSHFTELSLRCKTNPRVLVAAMEFDSGRPTYKLRLDELGSSHAIEVAARLGLPERLLARARSLLSTAKLDYERAQDQLKEKEAALELEAKQLRATLERQKDSWRRELQEKLASFMEQTKRTMDEAIASLTSKTGSKVRVAMSAQEIARSLERQSKHMNEALLEQDPSPDPEPLKVGDKVKVRSMRNATGIVLALHEHGTATVQAGSFKVEQPQSELTRIVEKKQISRLPGYLGVDIAAGAVSTKLDLRGLRYDEAIAKAEQYIDQAFRSGAPTVTVITGHGTGALKKGLRELLSSLPYIREFKPERANDDGATLIEFDR